MQEIWIRTKDVNKFGLSVSHTQAVISLILTAFFFGIGILWASSEVDSYAILTGLVVLGACLTVGKQQLSEVSAYQWYRGITPTAIGLRRYAVTLAVLALAIALIF